MGNTTLEWCVSNADMYRSLPYPKFLIKSPFFLGKKNIKCIYAWDLSLYHSGLLFSFYLSPLPQKNPYTLIIMNPILPFLCQVLWVFCFVLFFTLILLHHRSFCLESHLPPLDKFYPLRSTAGITSSQETFLSPAS